MSRTLPTAQLQELLDTNPRTRLIDVRTAGEFASVHIPGSYNVPLDLLREHRTELSAEHDDPVVLVCASGARAEQARGVLDGSGLEHIHVLEGGIGGWETADGPVHHGRGVWAMERQVRLVAGSLVLIGVVAGMAYEPLTWIAGFVGAGLTFAALTNTCAMARLLGLLPFNRTDTRTSDEALSALIADDSTASANRSG